MSQAGRDQNSVPTLLALSSVDGVTPVAVYANPTTHRLLVDLSSGTGTVTSISVVSANGFAGTVATATTTPAITLTTTVTGILSGNGTAISATTTTGSGSVVLATSPTLVGPALGTPISGVATNLTGLPLTTGVTGVLGIANGGTNASSASITAFNNITGLSAAGTTGTTSTNLVFSTSPALTTPSLGVATATSINGNILTTGSSTYTGTAGQTYTFPTTSATIARIDAANTFTGVQSMTSPDITTSITTATTSFTAWAGATTLLTIGGTGASASLFAPSTLDTTSSITGAIRTSGGISAAKAGNIGTTLSVGISIATGFTTTATATGTTTMTIASTEEQYWTGTATQIVKLPTTSVLAGARYTITNQSTGLVSVQSSGANAICTLGLNQSATFNAIVATPTSAANWTYVKQNVSANTNGKRILVVTQSATPSMDTDNGDIMQITGLAQAITSLTTNLTGTPVAGDIIELQITDSGTGRALTFGASFGSSTTTLPTTTVASTMLRILFQYDTLWRCIAVA